jgi:transcriptional regulator with XRE-family HTH domain
MRRARVTKEFGYRVRLAREQQGFSQERLAEHTSMSLTYMGMIERGESNPSLIKISRIAKALDLSLAELFQGVRY